MPYPSRKPFAATHGATTDTQPGAPWQVSLVRVSRGIAARRLFVAGNATCEHWYLFASREQFDVCTAADPMRFTDPLHFAKLKREFDHAFDRPDRSAVHPAAVDQSGIR